MKLNYNQKRVFCGINAYPDYNDRQIAEVLGMSRSTVTAARHFLLKNELYKTYLFPDFEKVGAKIIAVKYGNYDKIIPLAYKKRMELMPLKIKIKENIFSFSSEFKGLSLFYASELYPIKDKIDAWNALFESIDPNVQIRDICIPKQMITAFKFMELQECLAPVLGVEPLPPPKKSEANSKLTNNKAAKRKSFSRKEKQVLLSWVKKPSATNAWIAKKAGVSRAVVGLIKKRLLDSGIIRTIPFPKWPLLGLNLGVIMYLKLKPNNFSTITKIAQSPKIVFFLSSSYEIILFAVFRDYHEYHQLFFPMIKKFKNEKKFIREPEELLFSLEETTFVINVYPLLRQTFSEKGGF